MRTACKIAPNEKNKETGMDRLYDLVREQKEEDQARIAALEAQNAEILTLVKRLATGAEDRAAARPGPEVVIQASNGAQVAVDNRHAMITINVFGKEGLDHITEKHIKAILDESMRTPASAAAANMAVLKTAVLAYSDPEHPENLTCYLPNKKMNDALVHMSRPDGTTGWEVQPTTLVLPPMAQKSVDALFDNQPFEDAGAYEPLMKELRDNEARYTTGEELRPVLVRNKDLLRRVLQELPLAGNV